MTVVLTQARALARLLAGASAAIVWVGLAAGPSRAAPEIGKPAPALAATELNGQSFDLAKLKGKVVLVNYWATWCAPCKKDMPKLNAFYRRYHDRDLEMIGISVDRPSDLAKVRKVMTALSYPVAMLKDVTDNGFGSPDGVPVTFIIDTGGMVRDMMIDVRDELLDKLVVPLLPTAR